MTVSPTWPQDGNRQPPDTGSGVDSGDSYRSPALPPTLFQLPGLDSDSKEPQREEPQREEPHQATAVEPHSSTTTQPVPAPPSPPQQPPAQESVPEKFSIREVPAPATDSDDGPQSPLPPAIPTATATASHRGTQAEQPAGRSWMESVGSNGVVVVLLLVVIAAAWMTGRKSGNEDAESSLAEHGELLDFDEGTEFDLPMPEHGLDSSTGFAASAEIPASTSPEPRPTPQADTENFASFDSQQTQPESSAGSILPTLEFSRLNSSEEIDAPAASVAQLDTPNENMAAGETFESEPNADRTDATRVRTNEFVAAPTGIDVRAASNRVPTENVGISLPSLEDLADEQSTSATNMNGPQRAYSKTPKGFNQEFLSQYLQALQDAASTDAAISTSSE